MTNLDKLLRKIEKNAETKDKQEEYIFNIAGEDIKVLTMTRKQKADFFYNQKIGNEGLNIGDMVKSMIPTIYTCFQLKEIAQKAKEEGYINKFYDVVEMLFEPDELIEIVTHLVEKNRLGTNTINEAVDCVKKQ